MAKVTALLSPFYGHLIPVDQSIETVSMLPGHMFGHPLSDALALVATAISCLLKSILGFQIFFGAYVFTIYSMLLHRWSWVQKGAKQLNAQYSTSIEVGLWTPLVPHPHLTSDTNEWQMKQFLEF